MITVDSYRRTHDVLTIILKARIFNHKGDKSVSGWSIFYVRANEMEQKHWIKLYNLSSV